MQIYGVLFIIFVLTVSLRAARNGRCYVPQVLNGDFKEEASRIHPMNWTTLTFERISRYENVQLGSIKPHGREIFLFCDEGFFVQGTESSKAIATCLNGSWSPDPVCLKKGTKHSPTTALTTIPVEGPAPEDECSCEYTLDDIHIIAYADGKLVKLHDRVKNGSILTFRCAKVGYHRFVGTKKIKCENCKFKNIIDSPSCTRPERGDAMIFLDKTMNVSLEGVLEVQKFKTLRLVCSVMETAEFPIWNVPNVAGINLTDKTVKSNKNVQLFLSHLEIDKVMPEDAGSYTCAPNKEKGRTAVVQVQVLDEVPLYPDIASSVPATVTSFKRLISGKIGESDGVLSDRTKSSTRTAEDLPSKQHDDCTCTYFRQDSNRLMNGEKEPVVIRVKQGKTAVLHCVDPEMNLVWQYRPFTAKSINLSCDDCRKYESDEIPSCQGSHLDEVPVNPTKASSVPVPTRSSKGTDSSSKARSSPRIVEPHRSKHFQGCSCTYFRQDNYRLVNGGKAQHAIHVKQGKIAVLHCTDPEMNLVWQNVAFTAKSVKLTCNDCRKYKSDEIPSCQGSRLKTS